MNTSTNTVAADIYNVDQPERAGRGVYVAVSGNTGAGKSTLITSVTERLRMQGVDAIGVSERLFHHRYLRLMFSQSAQFAFPIQLSFMLERHMVLLRNLVGLSHTIVMERSHLDDPLFVDEHVRTGAITEEQREAYRHLARVLHAKLPAPDVIVLMNPDPELSLRRLALAEERGDRPKEFPNEKAKTEWVHRWYNMYENLHRNLRERALSDPYMARTTLLEVDSSRPPGAAVDEVIAVVRPLLAS